MSRPHNTLTAAALLGALALPMFAHADPCKLEISGNDQMQYDKQQLTAPASCKDITVTLHHNGKQGHARRPMHPDAIDRVVRKYGAALGLARGYSAHSMRATFITTALENGAQLEDVQKAAGHRDPSTTKLYDRRGYNPEKAASFFATY